jgi:hypothetical protein
MPIDVPDDLLVLVVHVAAAAPEERPPALLGEAAEFAADYSLHVPAVVPVVVVAVAASKGMQARP